MNDDTNYTVTLRLLTQKWQEDIINKKMNIARSIYNSYLGNLYKIYNAMCRNTDFLKLKYELTSLFKKINCCKDEIESNRLMLEKKTYIRI